MPFLKLRGSNRFGRWAKLLFFTLFLGLPTSLQAQQALNPGPLRVVLVQIDSFSEAEEIQKALSAGEGVQKVLPIEVAPGLVTLQVQGGVAERLVEGLKGIFGIKYTIIQKTLPSGTIEINVSKPL